MVPHVWGFDAYGHQESEWRVLGILCSHGPLACFDHDTYSLPLLWLFLNTSRKASSGWYAFCADWLTCMGWLAANEATLPYHTFQHSVSSIVVIARKHMKQRSAKIQYHRCGAYSLGTQQVPTCSKHNFKFEDWILRSSSRSFINFTHLPSSTVFQPMFTHKLKRLTMDVSNKLKVKML